MEPVVLAEQGGRYMVALLSGGNQSWWPKLEAEHGGSFW
jgi:hypothetical protein